VIAAIAELDADVVCLQEVPRFAFSALRLRRFARECGLVPVAAGRPAAGTAVLVRRHVVVRRSQRLLLSRTRGRHRRAVVAATVLVDGVRVTVASVHLGLDAEERERHAAEVLTAVAGFDGPYVVAGDMNEGPEGAAWQLLEATIGPAVSADRPSFPSTAPRHVIDTAFVSDGFLASLVEVAETTASDHLPVAVNLS
jgi:endonuclease/exonuclease/phosphatase family metal-dependent hydrolase